MKQRLSSKVDISNPQHRKNAINDLLDFHNETEDDLWDGFICFLEEVETEMNKRLQPGTQKIKLCDVNAVVEIVSTINKKPFGG